MIYGADGARTESRALCALKYLMLVLHGVALWADKLFHTFVPLFFLVRIHSENCKLGTRFSTFMI